MKLLTKKKQERLMSDLLDIYLMGSDALKAIGARLERSFARCLGLTALYEQRREKTSKKHKKD